MPLISADQAQPDVPTQTGRGETHHALDARNMPDGPFNLSEEEQHCIVQQIPSVNLPSWNESGYTLRDPCFAAFHRHPAGQSTSATAPIGERVSNRIPTTLVLSLQERSHTASEDGQISTAPRQRGLASYAAFSQLELSPSDGATGTFTDFMANLPANERTSALIQDGTIRWAPDNLDAAVDQLQILRSTMRNGTALDPHSVRTYWMTLSGENETSHEDPVDEFTSATAAERLTALDLPASLIVFEEGEDVDLRNLSGRGVTSTDQFDSLTLGGKAATLCRAASGMAGSTIIHCLPDVLQASWKHYETDRVAGEDLYKHPITAADLAKLNTEVGSAEEGGHAVVVTTTSRLYPQLADYLYDTSMSPSEFASLTTQRNESYIAPDTDSVESLRRRPPSGYRGRGDRRGGRGGMRGGGRRGGL